MAPLTMRVEVDGFDPIEQVIARGIVKGMVEDGLNPEKARQVGRCIAEAVGAYRRTMDEPTQDKPKLMILPPYYDLRAEFVRHMDGCRGRGPDSECTCGAVAFLCGLDEAFSG